MVRKRAGKQDQESGTKDRQEDNVQLHQRLDSISASVRQLREDMEDEVKVRMSAVMEPEAARFEEMTQNMQTLAMKVDRLEKLLFHADPAAFEAIDRLLEQLRHRQPELEKPPALGTMPTSSTTSSAIQTDTAEGYQASAQIPGTVRILQRQQPAMPTSSMTSTATQTDTAEVYKIAEASSCSDSDSLSDNHGEQKLAECAIKAAVGRNDWYYVDSLQVGDVVKATACFDTVDERI